MAAEWKTHQHVSRYLDRADDYVRRNEGEEVLLAHLPERVDRVLDLGTGDGRLLALVLGANPAGAGVGLDFSAPMLTAARSRFEGDERIELLEHDLGRPLPDLGRFDAVVSSFAIHHLEDARKQAVYGESLEMLEPGGVFANLEHVASPTPRLHHAFFEAIGEAIEDEDPSDRTIDVWTQVEWLRDLGFDDADCYWKWLEMALIVGVKPREPSSGPDVSGVRER